MSLFHYIRTNTRIIVKFTSEFHIKITPPQGGGIHNVVILKVVNNSTTCL